MSGDDIKRAARTPHRGFLVAAFIVSLLAAAAYWYQDDIIQDSPGGSPTPFALLIVFLVLLALFLVLCFRVPAWGNRFLGYDIVLNPDQKGPTDGYHYTGAFKAETGVSEKMAASKRLKARQTRRKYARATRSPKLSQSTDEEA